MKSVILALLPGLEEETSEDFDRTLKILEKFKAAIRPPDCDDLTVTDSSGDDFFWQCFFLATITGQSRRPGALTYLNRRLPKLGHPLTQDIHPSETETLSSELSKLVTSPEPGLLLRCFAAGLGDEQLLIQRGFLDLLVTHLPLHSQVLQKRVKDEDLELLLRAAAGVVTRREMSLNRRLWAWFLGPDPPSQEPESGLESPISPSDHHGFYSSKTSYFEEYGLRPLTRALLSMINSAPSNNPTERARPYRICLSLMDRWEIGGLVVPEIFLPVIISVKKFKSSSSSKAEFSEVLRSASVFFDGVESGLIYGEMVGLMAQALGLSPGDTTGIEQDEKLALVQFIMTHFSIREEEMITLHAPLAALSVLTMLEDVRESKSQSKAPNEGGNSTLSSRALEIARDLIELIPERAFPTGSGERNSVGSIEGPVVASMSNGEILKKIKHFYVSDQGNIEATPMPFAPRTIGALLSQKACNLTCDTLSGADHEIPMSIRSRVMGLLLSKIPQEYPVDTERLLAAMQVRLSIPNITFVSFKSILSLSTQLYACDRIPTTNLSDLVEPLVRHAWSFLSLSEPKYHVETVRCLWQLQTALGISSRDIEAVITDLMLKDGITGTFALRSADPGRSFTILWSHTLQDNSLHADRRSPKTPTESRITHRLSGMDHYDVMLTRPLFLMLDSLLDERTQLFMMVKNWLNTMVGIDK